MKKTDTNQLDTLNQVLNLTFQNNLTFLKKEYPSLYNRFSRFTPSEYQLQFDSRGFLNLVSASGAIYNEDPQAFACRQLESHKQAAIRSLYSAQYSDPKDAPVHFRHLDFLNELITAADKIASKEQGTQKELLEYDPLLVVLGVGLGYHLEGLFDQQIGHIHIVEPNEDFFFASLFVVDYAFLISKFIKLGRDISFDIGVDRKGFVNNIQQLFNHTGIYVSGSLPVFSHYNSEIMLQLKTDLFDNATQFYSGFGFLEDELLSVEQTRQNLKTGLGLLLNQTPFDQYSSAPVFIVGNGPSLDSDIEFIKTHRKHVLVFSCGSAMHPLYKAGIKPDIHFEVERTDYIAEWISLIDDEDYFNSVPLVAAHNVAPIVLNKFKHKFAFLKPNDPGTDIILQLAGHESSRLLQAYGSNPQVGNGVLAFALYMGFVNIHLFGIDAGYKDKKYHHSKDSEYYGKFADKFGVARDGNKEVKGNFGGTVYTENVYDHSRHVLEWILSQPEFSHVKCVNCSDGAHIEGTIAIRSRELIIPETTLPDILAVLNRATQIVGQEADAPVYSHLYQITEQQISALITLLEQNQVNNYQYLCLLFDAMNKIVRNSQTNEDAICTRLLAGSVNHTQTLIAGKIYELKTTKSRNQYVNEVQGILKNYWLEMKEQHLKDVYKVQ